MNWFVEVIQFVGLYMKSIQIYSETTLIMNISS